jgi:hypothetical protein
MLSLSLSLSHSFTLSLLQILAILFLLLAPLHFSTSCPIPTGCIHLPDIAQYTLQSQNHQLLQITTNISTSKGYNFRPQAVQPTLHATNMNMGQPITSNGCEGIFNFTSHNISIESPCPWSYKCDYNPQRIPAFIFHATCKSPDPQGSEGFCEEVYYPIFYLTTRSCDPLEDSEWSLETTFLPVACNLRDPLAELNQ